MSESDFLRLGRDLAEKGDHKGAFSVVNQAFQEYPQSIKVATAGIKQAKRVKRWSDVIQIGRAHWGNLSDRAASIILEAYIRSGEHSEALRFIGANKATRFSDEIDLERLDVILGFADTSPAFKRELNQLAGKDCIVFGSAPSPSFGEQLPSGEPIICCNGSGYTLQQQFRLKATYSFVHSHVLARDSESDAEARRAFENVSDLGRLIVLTEKRHEHNAHEAFQLNWASRAFYLQSLIGANAPFLNFSTGAFAVIAAFFAGARSVRLVGFSFSNKGHSYNNSQRYRNHVSSDAAIYAMLTELGYSIFAEAADIGAIVRRKID